MTSLIEGAIAATALVRGDAHQATASVFSGSDAPIDDFVRLFAPGDARRRLQDPAKPYVNTTGATWHVQSLGGVPAPVIESAVAVFQQAATIRDLFFPARGNTPSVHVSIRPIFADAQTKAGHPLAGPDQHRLEARQHPRRQRHLARRRGERRLVELHPPPASFPLHDEGPQALFRRLGNAEIERGDEPGHFFAHFRSGARHATFAFETGFQASPLDRNALQSFHCPMVR